MIIPHARLRAKQLIGSEAETVAFEELLADLELEGVAFDLEFVRRGKFELGLPLSGRVALPSTLCVVPPGPTS